MKVLLKNNNITISKIVSLFVLFQALNLLNLSLANYFISPINIFRFKPFTTLLNYFANFDGIHYYRIATEGYGLFEQAFFPFYPILIKILSLPLPANYTFFIGLIISNLSFLAFMFIFHSLVKKYYGEKNAFETIIFLLLFPTSFFFVSFYTEGLFVLLFILVIYFLDKEKLLAASLFAFLCALTKLLGVFVIIPILVFLFFQKGALTYRKILLILSPILGLFTYSFYLFLTKGDFLMYINTQPEFGANRSTSLVLLPQVFYRYLRIFTTADFDFKYFIAVIEFLIFTIVFLLLLFQLYKLLKKREFVHDRSSKFLLGLNLFSLSSIVVPTLSGTFSSVPRYALLSLSFFLMLGRIKSNIIKVLIGVVFLIFHVILFAFFAQGYFVS